MSSHAHIYCKTLSALPAPDAINAIHKAYMQFLATEKGVEGLDNGPIMRELVRLLTLSGHIGFTPDPRDNGPTQAELGQAELKNAFDRVCNPRDWKAPINALVLGTDLEITRAAIEHFTGTIPLHHFAGLDDDCASVYQITSPGYRAGPAGDH